MLNPTNVMELQKAGVVPVDVAEWLDLFDPRTPDERELDELAEYIEQQLEDARVDYGGI